MLRKKQKEDVTTRSNIGMFVIAKGELSRLKEGILKRNITTLDVINIETTDYGFTVWFRY
jgi:hypothetical protein